MSDKTLRIFISSTAIDMEDYKKKVTDAIMRLNNLPVKMDHFSAIPQSPVNVCKQKVSEANALVVMIGHRYGWVPSEIDGGDGKKSITWFEVETAIENEIPVFAFIVDEKHPWTEPREEFQLTLTKDQKEKLVILEKVESLVEFKKYINTNNKLTRDIFTTPDDLATKVTASLANWKPNLETIKIAPLDRPAFQCRIVHHLQPATHFRGRKLLLDSLKEWWQMPVTPDRVRSLVAIGGTGKTAIVERFLDSIKNDKFSGSILVWSFYDDSNTDAFLREACLLFTGKEPETVGGTLQILQRALAADNSQHLLVLDGMERIQSEGRASLHAKGDLEDHRLKNLLRSIAAGQLGNTRALITTRFKLTDLAKWENAGYKSTNLEVLDEATAISLLEAWKIKGTNEQLAAIAKSVGWHALSVSVLGSFLYNYCNGDPAAASQFNLDDAATDDTQAAKLARILTGYAKNLATQERDLIVRLSVFPNGITVDILGYLINAGGAVAGTLIGVNQQKLVMIAEKLKQQGLIYSYKNNNSILYTAHPFLRAYFKTLLGVKPEDIHEVVMNKLAIGLDTKPANQPTDTETLDRYEKLIEHSIWAGHNSDAYDLFQNVMSGKYGNSNLYHRIGDYGRIIRIISLFTKDGNPEAFNRNLSDDSKASLLNLWGLAKAALGDLKTAIKLFNIELEISKESEKTLGSSQGLQNIAWLNIHRGNFPTVKKHLDKSFNYLLNENKQDGNVNYILRSNNSHLAYAYHCMGEINLAKKHFAIATELNQIPLYANGAIFEIEHLIDTNKIEMASKRATENLNTCKENNWKKSLCQCHFIIGKLVLPLSIEQGKKELQFVREWPEKSGHMELIINSNILAAEIAFCENDYAAAIAEANAGLEHTENCDFGKLNIDILLLLAKIFLAIPNYNHALSHARKAYELSAHNDCMYAWGQANGLHLCGVCHKGLGEYELARIRLQEALVIREKIEHPQLDDTKKLLEELG